MAVFIRDGIFNRLDLSAQAMRPSLTVWSRLEALPYTPDLQPGLQAQIADPLWLMGRQWQFNELQGEDAGTPVDVRVNGERASLSRYALGPADANMGARAKDYGTEALPLEVLVERETLRATHPRANIEAGLQFIDGLIAEGVGALVPLYSAQFPCALLDERGVDELVDPKAAAWRTLLAGRDVDAAALAQALRPFVQSDGSVANLPAQPAVPEANKAAVMRAATRWLRWYDSAIVEPGATTGTSAAPEAWNPRRLEYAFAVQANLSDGPVVLRADEYTDGALDWYSFDVADVPGLGQPTQPVAPVPMQFTPMLPTPVRYPGMPADRYWEYEDGPVNFGLLEANNTDLSRMVMTEFALAFGNDWFVVPLDLPVGCVFKINKMTVRDTFGIESVINPSRNSDNTPWTMFSQSLTRDATPGAALRLRDVFFMAPTLPFRLESDALEEVALFRDEMANMVWGVERRVQGASGEAFSRDEEATQTIAHQQLGAESGAERDGEIAAEVVYRLMTRVPDHWIPFLPVPLVPNQPASQFAVQLERRALTHVLLDGTRQPIFPKGVLLRSNPAVLPSEEPLMQLEEEEVPRDGIHVKRAVQYSRWLSGRSLVWMGRSKEAGRGEGSSGLRFDAIMGKGST